MLSVAHSRHVYKDHVCGTLRNLMMGGIYNVRMCASPAKGMLMVVRGTRRVSKHAAMAYMSMDGTWAWVIDSSGCPPMFGARDVSCLSNYEVFINQGV